MILALVGQPNCGKSTLFNSVAGYRTVVSNFAGTTVELSESEVRIGGRVVRLVEVPGFYSFVGSSEEDRIPRNALLTLRPDVIVNVVDASRLSRSLELTLELRELARPMVVALNMMDEARARGVEIDTEHLARDLGVPVLPVVATRGVGLGALFETALGPGAEPAPSPPLEMSRDVEVVIERLARALPEEIPGDPFRGLPRRFLALQLLEGDREIAGVLYAAQPELERETLSCARLLADAHGRPTDLVIGSERHALSMNLFEHVARVRRGVRRSFDERLDDVVMHPWIGLLVLLAVLFGFFSFVFGLGRLVEAPLLEAFAGLDAWITRDYTAGELPAALLHGVLQGFSGGIGIVLPYLVPFLFGLALLEDLGYIPRAAFLVDALMHRVGLHGKAVIPFVLGYGCTVPAIMAVRTLDSRRDRLTAGVLVNFIPCAARTTVIFALVGFFIGPLHALGFYVLNLFVIAVAGRLLHAILGGEAAGLVMEIPPYRLPALAPLLRKVWFRMREFVVLAWPLLIVGSIALGMLDHLSLTAPINSVLAPFTAGLLGLPAETGISLIFGVLRKELTLVMLVQGLGTTDFGAVLTHTQMATYTAFILFYMPCLATLAMLKTVLGLRGMLFSLVATSGVATLVALLVRLLWSSAG